MSRPFKSRLPLEWRLPLAISAVLLVALAGVSWLGYRQVTRTAREAAVERLQSIIGQLAPGLGARGVRDVERLRRVAESLVLRDVLKDSAAGGRAAALQLLNAVVVRTTTPRPVVELRDTAGRRVLAAGADTAITSAQPAENVARIVARDSAGIGPLVEFGERIAWPTVATVFDDDAPLGYLVEWSYLDPSPAERDGIAALIGNDAVFLIGSAEGVWTDQVELVAPPPFDVTATTEPVTYVRPELGRRLAVAAPAPGTPWFTLIEVSEARVLARARMFLRRVSLAALVLLGLALVSMVLLVRRITQPLRVITDAAESLSRGDYSRRVNLTGDDEIARLGSTFDHMAERIEETHEHLQQNVRELRKTQEQLFHAQRMEATGRLAGGIAHDFNNLLTVILGEAELASGMQMSAEAQESLHEVRRAGQRAAELTRQLLAFSRHQVLETTVFDINALVRDIERLLTRVIGEDVRLVVRPAAERPMVRADRGQIEQVILNLAINARDAMPEGGRLLLETGNVTLDEDYARSRNDVTPGEYVMLAVSDTGTGMSEEVAAHIFEPFFTTKPRGKGTGLGLASSYGITRQIGGHIAAYSEPGVGTTMRVYLPWTAADTDAPAAPARPRRGGDETILLVEDEAGVRDIAGRMLDRLGYRVLSAGDAEEAVSIAQGTSEPIHLLLTDVVLPGVGGRELADRITSMRPAIRVLFTSGYTDDVILEHRLISDEIVLLQKPYTSDSLAAKVREVLDF